jgi:hypothetical protein
MYRSIGICLLLFNYAVYSHEMTPTYPKWQISSVQGIKKTTMELWNSREDVGYYEVGVFDGEWKPIPFVTAYKIIKLNYLSKVNFDIYIREKDIVEARYVCSLSKLRSNNESKTLLATRICSKFK